MATSPRYVVAEVTNLTTRAKSYKVYERKDNTRVPVTIGFATRDEAEVKLHEMEQGDVKP